MALDAFASYNRNDPNPRKTVRNSFPGTNAGKNVPRPADYLSRGTNQAFFVPEVQASGRQASSAGSVGSAGSAFLAFSRIIWADSRS